MGVNSGREPPAPYTLAGAHLIQGRYVRAKSALNAGQLYRVQATPTRERSGSSGIEMETSNFMQLATVLDHVLSSRGDGPRVLPVAGLKARGLWSQRDQIDDQMNAPRPLGQIMVDLLRRDTLHRMRPCLGNRGEALHASVCSDMEAAPFVERQRTSLQNGLSDIPLGDLQHTSDASKLVSMSSVVGYNTLFDTLHHSEMGLICDAVASTDRATTAFCARTKRAVLACAADRSNRCVLHAAPAIAATANELAAQRGATYTAPGLRFFDVPLASVAAPTCAVDALELRRAALTFSTATVLPMTQLEAGVGARTRYKALQHAQKTLAHRTVSQIPSWMRRCLPISQAAVSINAAAICSVWFSLVTSLEAGILL